MGTGIKGKRKEEKKKNVHTVREERKREREFVDCGGIRLKGNEGRGMKKKEWFRARDRNNVKERGRGEREARRGKSSRDGGEALARINT